MRSCEGLQLVMTARCVHGGAILLTYLRKLRREKKEYLQLLFFLFPAPGSALVALFLHLSLFPPHLAWNSLWSTGCSLKIGIPGAQVTPQFKHSQSERFHFLLSSPSPPITWLSIRLSAVHPSDSLPTPLPVLAARLIRWRVFLSR